MKPASLHGRERAQSPRYDPRFVLLSTTLLFDGAEPDLVPKAVEQVRRCWPDAVIVLAA